MYSEIQIGKLFPSPLNPRRSVNQTRLKELEASIREHGIIEPLVVRKQGQRFEIVCGSRRYTAALAADLVEVPVVVRKLSDVAALEMALIENVQDEELHPLDEAAGYDALLKAGAGKTTHASIGQKVGKTPAHVFKRCQLLTLSTPVLKAFAAGRITAGHADRLTRVPSKKQADALETCFHPLFRSFLYDDDAPHTEPAPVAELDEWIARNVKETLDDDSILHVFPELLEQADGDHPEDVIPELIGLSESHHAGSDLQDRKHRLINAGAWTEIKPGAKMCGNQRQGVVLHGGPVRILTVCAKKGCSKHRPPKKTADGAASVSTKDTRPSWEVEESKRQVVRAAWELLRAKLIAGFIAHVANLPILPALIEEFIGWHLKPVQEAVGTKKITKANMGQFIAVAILLSGQTHDRQSFRQSVKPFGFNIGSIEQRHKRELKAAAKKVAGGKTQAAKKPTKAAAQKKAKRKPKKGRGWGASAGR